MAILPTPKTRDSKYLRLAEHLRRQIEAGVLKPGDQLPSYAQMLSEYGVGQNTVEKMYALLDQEGLIIRQPNRGTFVAVPKRRGTTGAIGLIIDPEEPASHPYHCHLLIAIHQAAFRAGMEVVLLHEKSHIGLEKVDGVLFRQFDADRISKRLPAGMPTVSLLYKSSRMPSVVADDYGGMKAAIEHLLRLNHRKIAFLSGGIQEWTDRSSAQRLLAYRETLKANGIVPTARWIRPVLQPYDQMPMPFEEAGRARMQLWLRESWHEVGFTALVTQNDDVAIGAIEAFHAAGIRVPEQVSVIGFDGTDIAEAFRPRLTSVEMPLREIGARGVELLLEQIASRHAAGDTPLAEPATVVLPIRLVVRDSTEKVNEDRSH